MLQLGSTSNCGENIFILKGIFAEGNDTMGVLTIDSDNAGIYTIISDDGASGSITISKNGGSFAAFSSPLVLSVDDTLEVNRSITTSIGYFKLTGAN